MKSLLPALLLAWPLAALAAGYNDTGITSCGDSDTTNGSDDTICANAMNDTGNYPRQDARFGRTAMEQAGVLYKKGSSNTKGRDYTKLGANGNPLAIQDQAWSVGAGYDNGSEAAGTKWSCVRDNVTGLIWEVKTHANPADLRDNGWTYSWYDTASATNGGADGTANNGTCFDKYNASTNPDGNRCDTSGYAAAVNAAGLCGANDWRMPTVKELEGLADFNRDSPAIDSAWFPNTQSSYFWSVSPYAGDTGIAWFVSFDVGYADGGYRSFTNYVRLVRVGQ